MCKLVIFLSLLLLTHAALADGEKGKCEITIRTHYFEGSPKLDVDEVPAADEGECRKLAKQRRIIKDPSKISSIDASFNFQPAGE
jgi:hypothetical protein